MAEMTLEQQQAMAMASARLRLQQQPTEIPVARQPPSTLDVTTSAPYKALAGVADLFINTPQNVANLAKMAYGTAVTAAGYPSMAPEVTAPRQPVSEAFQRMGLIKPTEGMTTGQRILDVGLQAATGGAISPAATARVARRTGAADARAAFGPRTQRRLTRAQRSVTPPADVRAARSARSLPRPAREDATNLSRRRRCGRAAAPRTRSSSWRRGRPRRCARPAGRRRRSAGCALPC